MTDELRVSDEQRDAAAKEIRDHFAAGRLSDEELSDRLSAVYKAQTVGELHSLSRDLPVLPAVQRAQRVQRRRHLQRRALQEGGGGVGLFLLCTVIWVASGATGQFWPIWVALVAVLPFVRTMWSLYGPAADLDEVEREMNERRERRAQERARHRGGHGS